MEFSQHWTYLLRIISVLTIVSSFSAHAVTWRDNFDDLSQWQGGNHLAQDGVLTVFINLLKPTHGLNEPIPTAQGARKAVECFPESSRDSCPVYHQGEPQRSN